MMNAEWIKLTESLSLFALLGLSLGVDNLVSDCDSGVVQGLPAVLFGYFERAVLEALTEHHASNGASHFIFFNDGGDTNVLVDLGDGVKHFVVGGLIEEDSMVDLVLDLALGPFLYYRFGTLAAPFFLEVAALEICVLLFFSTLGMW